MGKNKVQLAGKISKIDKDIVKIRDMKGMTPLLKEAMVQELTEAKKALNKLITKKAIAKKKCSKDILV